jgi:DNA-binding protein H-NS
MAADLNNMSKDELIKLRKEVDEAINTHDARRRADALKAMEAVAKEHGLSIAEIVGSKPVKAGKSKTPAKYRNPENPEQTWSGRGRKPAWVHEQLEQGKQLEDMHI